MAIQEGAASEHSPLLTPSPSSITEVDESVNTASETEQDSQLGPLRGTVLGLCIAVLIFLQSQFPSGIVSTCATLTRAISSFSCQLLPDDNNSVVDCCRPRCIPERQLVHIHLPCTSSEILHAIPGLLTQVRLPERAQPPWPAAYVRSSLLEPTFSSLVSSWHWERSSVLWLPAWQSFLWDVPSMALAERPSFQYP